MPFQQLSLLKSEKFILSLILLVFFLKGVFWAAVFPIFQGPDEQIHYATSQFMAEPNIKDWGIKNSTLRNKIGDTETYNFSEEIKKTAAIVRFDEIRWKNHNKPYFSDSLDGEKEAEIKDSTWQRRIETYPPDVTTTNFNSYYLFPSAIEKIFSAADIFTRFFIDRIFSVILGTGIILLSFLTFKKIGFPLKISLLGAAIIAFQPMFSFMSAVISYDIMLFFCFSLFMLGAVSVLKDGPNRKNSSITILAVVLGIFTKGPAIILIIASYPLLVYAIYRKLASRKLLFLACFLSASIFLAIAGYFLTPKSYLHRITASSQKSVFSSRDESIKEYFKTTLTLPEFKETSLSYWGNFGWLDASLPDRTLNTILIVELLGFSGSLAYLAFRKQPFLPEKKIVLFFLSMIIFLQIAIRFYDWRVFDYLGEIAIGTPGRYFMPNLIAHFALIFTGFYLFLRKEEIFSAFLKLALVLMIGLNIYSILLVVIPRYYL